MRGRGLIGALAAGLVAQSNSHTPLMIPIFLHESISQLPRTEIRSIPMRKSVGAAPPSAGIPKIYPCRPTSGRSHSYNHKSSRPGDWPRLMCCKHGNAKAPATQTQESPGAKRNTYQRANHNWHLAGCDDPRHPRALPTYLRRRAPAFDRRNTRWISARTHAQQTYHKQDKKTTIAKEITQIWANKSPRYFLTEGHTKSRETADSLAKLQRPNKPRASWK